jgi:acyl carrier protein
MNEREAKRPRTADDRGPQESATQSTEAIEGWLVARVAELLGVAPHDIDVQLPFADYGMTSADAVALSGDLGDWLGRSLPATLAWDYPDIALLARHLAQAGGATRDCGRESAGE